MRTARRIIQITLTKHNVVDYQRKGEKWNLIASFNDSEELIKICGHYVFSDERFLNMKPNIDDKIKRIIKNKLKELQDG